MSNSFYPNHWANSSRQGVLKVEIWGWRDLVVCISKSVQLPYGSETFPNACKTWLSDQF